MDKHTHIHIYTHIYIYIYIRIRIHTHKHTHIYIYIYIYIYIQFVKEGNISKIARENMCKPSLLGGCTDWHVATDLKHNFIFSTGIALTIKRPDIAIWAIKVKKVFVLELTAPYEENFLQSQMQRFYCQLNLHFLN